MEELEKLKVLEAEYKESLRKKICTQSLKTINRFHEKYPMIPQEEEPLLKRHSDYKNVLQQFISVSFEAWGWDSEEKHQMLISTWTKRLSDPVNSEREQEWIRNWVSTSRCYCFAPLSSYEDGDVTLTRNKRHSLLRRHAVND